MKILLTGFMSDKWNWFWLYYLNFLKQYFHILYFIYIVRKTIFVSIKNSF